MKARANRLLGFALLALLAAPAVAEERLFLPQDFTKDSCDEAIPCPPGYDACTNWSAWTDCDVTICGESPVCGDCGELGPCPGPATKQARKRFRVCFNPQAQSCTQWQVVFNTLNCGCD